MPPEETVIIRPERSGDSADRAAISSINSAAFGVQDEADLVDRLRADGVVLVSLVADIAGKIVGHILFSRMSIDAPSGSVDAVALAPVAVLPSHQRRGIGSRLIRHGLDLLSQQGERIIIVVGHPEYYPRFGFSTERALLLESPFPAGRFHGYGSQPWRAGWGARQSQISQCLRDLKSLLEWDFQLMLRVYLAILLLLVSTACNRSAPAGVAATVNGRAITFAELDKQYQYSQFGQSEHPSDDQKAIQRLEVLRTLIDNEIMLQRAEQRGLMATDSDVDAKFAELKAPYTQEEFQKQLNERKMTMEDLKAQLRRDLSVQKLLNKETTSRISISDKDIAEFYNANKTNFNLPEPQIHLAQILVTPTPNPNVRNLRNDKAQNDAQARKKIDSLYVRVKQGEDFAMLAQNYSEDPDSAQAGGDVGFVRESALEQANIELRKAIMALQPGEVTPVERTAEGYRILKVITREPAGQRLLDDPAVQQTIRETLLNRKDQLLKAAYYEVARNEAKVVNYLASSVAGSSEQK